jgi:hypothetical protein
MPTKAPTKKKPVAKKKAVTKKPTARKLVATKKKHPLRRLLEYRIEGSVSKKGFLISLAVVVGIVLGITGYSLYQNNGANAGGVGTLGRGTSVGTITGYELNSKGIEDENYPVVGSLSVCRDNISSKKFTIKVDLIITSIKFKPNSYTSAARLLLNEIYEPDGAKVPFAVGSIATFSQTEQVDPGQSKENMQIGFAVTKTSGQGILAENLGYKTIEIGSIQTC